MSLSELGFSNITPFNTPIIVRVASSTGAGEAPDNGAEVYQQLLKRNGPSLFKGILFTMLALGNSNYSAYMKVPRSLKLR
jgi:sulfite reductase alpha subunit-like flavoprotein